MRRPGRLLIRADADARMGVGHVMRCLALAQRWRAAGGEACWLAVGAPAALVERARSCGLDVRVVEAVTGSPEDAAGSLQVVRELAADWVVLDGYHFPAPFRDALAAGPAPLLVIDDGGAAPPCEAALVLDQNVQASAEAYAGYGLRTRRLLGSAYVLLRDEFLCRGPGVRSVPIRVRNVLVTFGGGAATGLTSLALGALQATLSPDAKVVVVVGPAGDDAGLEGRGCGGGGPLVEVVRAEPEMATRMVAADLAITAGGTTLWELAYLGIPAIATVVAANQAASVAELARRRVILSVGPADALDRGTLIAAVRELLVDPSRRRSLAEAGRRLIDGKGAERVVSAMMGTP